MKATHHILRRSSAGSKGNKGNVHDSAALVGSVGSAGGTSTVGALTVVVLAGGETGGDGNSVTVTEMAGAEASALVVLGLCGLGREATSSWDGASFDSTAVLSFWSGAISYPLSVKWLEDGMG
jgi:hypothetical protein